MIITLYIKPESLTTFIGVINILKDLPLDNEYVFQPKDINYTEAMISNWTQVGLEVEEYLKFKFCYLKLS